MFSHLVVGLGNPGDRYRNTRHNVGFRVVEELARAKDLTWSTFQKSLVTELSLSPEINILLARPQTFMNLSGTAVQGILSWYKMPLSSLLLVYDDMDLPTGVLRLRRDGGPGGHNGVASVISTMGTEFFSRLRIGIGRPLKGDETSHVLGNFRPDEAVPIHIAIDMAVQAALVWSHLGIDQAMNRFNGTGRRGDEA